MISHVILGLFTVLLTSSAWNFFVRESRLKLNSEKTHFPTVSGSNLERQEFEFPGDFEGDYNLLFVPFKRWHQSIVDTWIPFAQELESNHPWLVYYELPTIDERPVLARTFINEGMRAGIPDQKSRQRTVTLYIDTDEFMKATDIADRDDVYVLLVNRDGDIVWRTKGEFTKTKGDELHQVINNLRAERKEA